MPSKRQVVQMVFEGRTPPYVPWHFIFTKEARHALVTALGAAGVADLERVLGNHLLMLRRSAGAYDPVGPGYVRDLFGVQWDRRLDKDIGVVSNCMLPAPTLKHFHWPDPLNPRWFTGFEDAVNAAPDRFRVFSASFSLYERAWALRGTENLLMDFHENPKFVEDLLDGLVEFNLAQIRHVMRYDIDCVYFGDDWGQQHGLIFGRPLWDRFIRPRIERLYKAVHDAGKFVMIHCCGDVDELFDTLIDIGVDCFNPFQPEVMSVDELLPRYRERLTFFGGLSTQQTLPHGNVEAVRAESRHLLDLGRAGGYIFAPAHAVEGDVPVENMLAFIREAQQQTGALQLIASK